MGTLTIAAATLDPERRTLILTTDPHPREAVYLLDARASRAPGARSTPTGVHPALIGSIAYDLNGVAVSWAAGAGEGEPAWEGWWPDLDPETSQQMTCSSREHDRGFALLSQAGRTTLESLVVLPKGRVVLRLVCSAPIEEVSLNGENPSTRDKTQAEFVVESTGDANALFVTVRADRAARPFSLRATYRSPTDESERALSRDRLSLPWSPPTPLPIQPDLTPPPFRLSGGDRDRGEVLFHGDRAKCSGCHTVSAKGGSVGPDLSNLADRGIEAIYRDIAEPSSSIHPDFNAYTVALKDGRVLAGIVRAAGAEKIRVTDTDAKITEIPRSEIEELRPSATSIMPVGLIGAIGEEETRDILAFLLSSTPRRGPAPKP
ncbi:c-type cytochrome [Singulisphaera sp. GP187]|uniref:c-type cytochrome n=1 Tax=Singulisphaera sp. GP187 TaxID=1882752 RepID=UPI0020B174C0|nr:c-type cytochrome [Singulisphaera sp. GP187]